MTKEHPPSTKLSQTQRLFNLLADNKPHRTDEIVRVVYPASNYCEHCGRGDFKNLARVGARIDDLKHGKWQGKTECVIRGWKEKGGKFYWYLMDSPVCFKVASEYKGFMVSSGAPIPQRVENLPPKADANQPSLFR